MSAMPRGFTIIEIAISLMILGILLALGLPSFVTWIGNTQIRSGADGVLNGIQLARAEAVRRNLSTQFVLTEAAATPPTTGWNVQVIDSAGAVVEVVQTRSKNEGSPNAVAVLTPADAAILTFNGMGRLIPNPDTSKTITQVDIVNPGAGTCEADGGGMRCMRISIGLGGNVRMCDPAPTLAAGDPRKC